MIIKAKERGDGRQLGLYLLRDTNEHVEVHELRGFVSDDLPMALQEVDAIGRCTKAQNYFFSASFNPPPNEKVSTDQFMKAIEAVEKKTGLDGQPRAVVFHEKDGRLHCHTVWSRIDAENMRAIHLSHYRLKLKDVAREQFLENGWKLPKGYISYRERDPANYTYAEWQRAKRSGIDGKALKGMFQELWAASDSGRAFTAALKSRGYTVARGDNNRIVAVDYRGEVYAIARQTRQKAKDVRSRIGDEKLLPSVDEAKADHARRMTDMLRKHVREADERRNREVEKLAAAREQIVLRQRNQRAELEKKQQVRIAAERGQLI
jgi:relaxase-like protein